MATVCTNCGFNNPPGMRFCGNCGTRLPAAPELAGASEPAGPSLIVDPTKSAVQPNTDAAVPDPAKLGVMTGADLLERFRQAGLEAAGQRRSVTVLFVDLTGYTHLSEELNDEALYELVQKFIRLLVKDVYKYEGMVDKLTGDGLMALFGAPIAHENNAERALRSALDMQQDVARLSRELDLGGRELSVHIGLNAGTVIVGGIGGEGLMNYTAIGDSVNLSRRLEEAAEGGTILVSESVYRQTNRLFDFDPLPPLQLKNISQPVIAYRVKGPKARPKSVRGLEGLHAPMIGREAEFSQVQSMVNRLTDERQGGVVLLMGEGGMGKSRLTAELKASLDYSRIRVLEGHSLTYRKSIAYWIFQDMLRGYLGVTADTPEDEVRYRLREAVMAHFRSDFREKMAYLEHMLSFEPFDREIAKRIRYLDPGQLRQQVFLAVRDLLIAESRQRPLLLILEDLHWADDASLDLIRFMLDSTRTEPILIYAISRPFEGGAVQAIHDRAGQRLSDRYLAIRLQALQPDQSSQLINALLAIPDLPETLLQQIIERSAGLPFYLEEILRMLIENNIIQRIMDPENGIDNWTLTPGADISSIGVPDTLQGLILTRFDRLTPVQRRVLQVASVVGYQFHGPVLYQVLQSFEDAPDGSSTQEAFTRLVEREFVAPVSQGATSAPASFASGVDEVYNFKHVLVSDAVYSTLLQRDRRDLHTRVGQAIEQLYADRLDGQIEVLASHFLRSPLLDRALHYLTLAGQKAARSFANEQARLLFGQALELLPKVAHTPQQALSVHTGIGDASLVCGDYSAAREQYVTASAVIGRRMSTGLLVTPETETFAIQIPREERIRLLSTLQRKIGQTYERQGDYEKALNWMQAALDMLEREPAGFVAERSSILTDIGWTYIRQGHLDEAEGILQKSLNLAESVGQLDLIASALNRLAAIYFQRDAVEQAARYLLRSLTIREQIGDIVAVARSYNNLGLLGWKQGDLVSALENFNRSFKLQSNLGDIEGAIDLRTNMGLIELDRGNLDEASRHLTEALDSAKQIGHFYHVCYAQMHLGLLNVYAENWRKALELTQLSLSGFQELGVRENQLDLYVQLGWSYRGLGDMQHLVETLERIKPLMVSDSNSDHQANSPSESQGRALRLLSQVVMDRGELSIARDLLEKSAKIFTQMGSQIERCRSLAALVNVLCSMGDMVSARSLLNEVRSILERMGASLELTRLKEVEARLS